MLRRTISVKDESTPTMSRLKACQSGAAANRRFSRGEVNVRYGSLADIGEGYQGCPLYPITDVGRHIQVCIWLSVYEYTP